jgi:hypothetical protein
MDTPYIWNRLAEKHLDPEIYGGRVEDRGPSTRMFSFGLGVDF